MEPSAFDGAAVTARLALAVLILLSGSCRRAIEPTTFAGRDPMLRWAADGSLHAIYVEGDGEQGRVIHRRIRPALGDAHAVSPRGARVSSHGEVPPSLEVLSNGSFVAFYTIALPGQWVGEIHMQRSNDDGATWSTPVVIHDDRRSGSHSFFSTKLLAGGSIGMAWLDSRGGQQGLQYATTRDGIRISRNVTIDDAVCECCGTEIETTPAATWIAYRDLEPGDIRDIALASAPRNAGWSRLGKVSDDRWSINACPHSGSRMLLRSDGSLWATWSSGTEGHLYAAMSRDGGKTFSPRTHIAGGAGRPARHPDIGELADGTPVVVYEAAGSSASHDGHHAGGGTRGSPIAVRHWRNGAWQQEVPVSAEGTYPRLARGPQTTVLSLTEWSKEGPIVVIRELQ
jgi:hypothetical protein